MGTGSKGGWSARSSTMRVSPTTQNQINNNIVQVVDGQAHAHTPKYVLSQCSASRCSPTYVPNSRSLGWLAHRHCSGQRIDGHKRLSSNPSSSSRYSTAVSYVPTRTYPPTHLCNQRPESGNPFRPNIPHQQELNSVLSNRRPLDSSPTPQLLHHKHRPQTCLCVCINQSRTHPRTHHLPHQHSPACLPLLFPPPPPTQSRACSSPSLGDMTSYACTSLE